MSPIPLPDSPKQLAMSPILPDSSQSFGEPAPALIFRSNSDKTISNVPDSPRFRGLLGVHSRYGLVTRGAAGATLSTRGFGKVVTSPTARIATGWSASCRVGIAPTEDQCLITAHNVPFPPYRRVANQAEINTEAVRIMPFRDGVSISGGERFQKNLKKRFTKTMTRAFTAIPIHMNTVNFHLGFILTLTLRNKNRFDRG